MMITMYHTMVKLIKILKITYTSSTINLVVLFILERGDKVADIKTKDIKPKTVKTIIKQ